MQYPFVFFQYPSLWCSLFCYLTSAVAALKSSDFWKLSLMTLRSVPQAVDATLPKATWHSFLWFMPQWPNPFFTPWLWLMSLINFRFPAWHLQYSTDTGILYNCGFLVLFVEKKKKKESKEKKMDKDNTSSRAGEWSDNMNRQLFCVPVIVMLLVFYTHLFSWSNVMQSLSHTYYDGEFDCFSIAV